MRTLACSLAPLSCTSACTGRGAFFFSADLAVAGVEGLGGTGSGRTGDRGRGGPTERAAHGWLPPGQRQTDRQTSHVSH